MKKSLIATLFAAAFVIAGCKAEAEVTLTSTIDWTLTNATGKTITLSFYEIDKDNKKEVIETTTMDSGQKTLTIECTLDETVCVGGKVDNAQLGCGENCSEYTTENALDLFTQNFCKKCGSLGMITSTFVIQSPTTAQMEWTIVKEKDIANPMANLYDVDDNKKAVLQNDFELADKTTKVNITCTPGHMICIGGDYKLDDVDMAFGCAKGCTDYEELKSDLISEKKCQPCKEGAGDVVTFTSFK